MSDQSNPVNWFEIPVSDLDRGKRFYEAMLGLELSLNEIGNVKMAWFPMTHTLYDMDWLAQVVEEYD